MHLLSTSENESHHVLKKNTVIKYGVVAQKKMKAHLSSF